MIRPHHGVAFSTSPNAIVYEWFSALSQNVITISPNQQHSDYKSIKVWHIINFIFEHFFSESEVDKYFQNGHVCFIFTEIINNMDLY